MGEPLRELVLEKMVEVARTMTGVRLGDDGQPWGQYPNDPVVSRDYLDDSQINQCPTINFSRGEGSGVLYTETVGGAILEGRGFFVDLYGYVRTTTDKLASTWLERLWADARKTFYANHTLGGLAATLTFDGEPVVFDVDKITAGFRQSIFVELAEVLSINDQ